MNILDVIEEMRNNSKKVEVRVKPKGMSVKSDIKESNQKVSLIGRLQQVINNPKADEEKQSIIKDYLVLTENQLKASNLVLKNINEDIKEEFKNLIKEMEANLISESYMEKVNQGVQYDLVDGVRAQRYHLEKIQDATLNWIRNDINNYYSNRYALLKNTDMEDIEVIRKIEINNSTVVLHTDENEYSFPSSKLSSIGGFIVLRAQIITETLDIDELAKEGRKNAQQSKKAEAEAKLWLMINPLLVQAPNGKVLVAKLDYLKHGFADYLETLAERRKLRSKFYKTFLTKEEQSELNALPSKRDIVLKLQKLELPEPNNCIVFPFGYLEDSGIEFINNVNGNNKEGILYETLVDYNFIPMETLEKQYKIRRNLKDIESLRSIVMKFNDTLSKVTDFYFAYDIFNEIITPSILVKKFGEYQAEQFYDFPSDTHPIIGCLAEGMSVYVPEGSTIPEILDNGFQDNEEYVKFKKGMKKYEKTRDKFIEFIYSLEKIHEISEAFENCFEITELLDLLNNANARLDLMEKILDSLYVDVFTEEWFITMYTVYNYYGDSTQFSELIIKLAQGNEETKNNFERDKLRAKEYLSNMVKEVKKIRERFIQVKNYCLEFQRYRDKFNNLLLSRAVPLSLSNLDCVKEIEVEDYKLPVNFGPILINSLLKLDGFEESLKNSYKMRLPIFASNGSVYEKVRSIVQKLQNREYVNWSEILKILLPPGRLQKSKIRLCPEIRELIDVLEEEIKSLNSAGKFYKSDKELPEEIHKFNKLINDLINHYKGAICSINFEKLISYIINVEEGEGISGLELMRFIPYPKLVSKYFEVPEEAVVYPAILNYNRLFTEIPNLPPIYLALNHMLNTVKMELDLIKGDLTESIPLLNSLNKLNKDLERINNRKHDDLSLANKHDNVIKQFYNFLGKLESIRQLCLTKKPYNEIKDEINQILEKESTSINIPYNRSLSSVTEEIEEMIKSPVKYQIPVSVAEKCSLIFNNLKEELSNVKKEILDEKLKAIQNKEKDINEKSAQIEEIKNQLNLFIEKRIQEVTDKALNLYDINEIKKKLYKAWVVMKFDKFRKGRVALTYLLTLVQDEPAQVQAAIFHIIIEFLLNLKENELTEKSEVDNIIRNFELLTFTLKLNTLKINKTDTVELLNALNEEKSSKISEEDKKLLDEFLKSLYGKDEEELKEAFLNFEKKELISPELYLKIVYGNEAENIRKYPKWYNPDFDLAENIKIMLLCGVSREALDQEHLKDNYLMWIVDNTEIDPDFIEKIKENLKEGES